MRALLAAAALAVCLPAAAQFKPSMAEQVKIGKEAAQKVRDDNRMIPASDPRSQAVARIGKALVEQIPQKERDAKKFEYSFEVIDSDEVNAFMLPGGPSFIYTGLLERVKTEDELAGIIGHEITHARNEHFANQYNDGMKRRVGLLVLLGVAGANSTLINVADLANQVLGDLTYSRRHETEADRVGYDLMAGAGYNPKGIADVFRMLGAGRKDPKWTEVLSTHPNPESRVKDIESRLAKDPKRSAYPAPKPWPHYKPKADGQGAEKGAPRRGDGGLAAYLRSLSKVPAPCGCR
jgi:predicted Zn-dependent protease